MADQDMRPAVAEVATLMHSRTFVMGSPHGTFDDATSPTEGQVEALIDEAMIHVNADVGTVGPDDEILPIARTLVTLRAAELIEISFFRNDVEDANSPFQRYRQLYDDMLTVATGDGEGGILGEGDRTINVVPLASVYSALTDFD